MITNTIDTKNDKDNENKYHNFEVITKIFLKDIINYRRVINTSELQIKINARKKEVHSLI